jgi:hypothetical protein
MCHPFMKHDTRDQRTARHAGYGVSQRKRKLVEQSFGWMKVIGMLKKMKLRGMEKVGWLLTFIRRRLQSLPIAKSPRAGGGLGDFHRVQFDKRVESGTICAYWSIAMDGAYDIFKKSSAKDAVWVETVQGFEQAKKRLLYYTSSSKDEYLVFDATEGHFIDVLGKAASA